MIRGADKVLGVIGKATHEVPISLILQYIGAKEMVNDLNGIISPVCTGFHPKG
jgi:hypothetical protein